VFMIREIIDLQNYHSKNEYLEFIRQYFLWILLYGTSKYIKNIHVEIKILEVWKTMRNNCYVWSILGFIDYAFYEYKKSTNIFFYTYVLFFVFPIVFLLRKINIEDIVYICNLLLSTNLLPDSKEKDLEDIHVSLILKYPWKYIIYRFISTVNLQYMSDCLNRADIKGFFDSWNYSRKFRNKVDCIHCDKAIYIL
jgi:hypothetical protein